MLTLSVPAAKPREFWNEETEEFLTVEEFKGEDLLLEHSLVSLSKWEQNTEKPFLGTEEKSTEETIEYVKLMTISPVVNSGVYDFLEKEHYDQISKYIDRKMTATWFREMEPSRPSGEIITNEIIYYWMVALQIPFECQYWHLNRLLTLIKVTNLKNAPPKKQGRTTSNADRRALAEKRRAEMGTSG